jgi:hypothetical protein
VIKRSSYWALLSLLVGVAVGAWGMRLYFGHTLGAWSPNMRLLAELDADLGLTADQRSRVSEILVEQKDRMEELRKQWKFQVETLSRQGENQVLQILGPAQTEKFVRQNDRIHMRMGRFLWSAAGSSAIAISGEVK